MLSVKFEHTNYMDDNNECSEVRFVALSIMIMIIIAIITTMANWPSRSLSQVVNHDQPKYHHHHYDYHHLCCQSLL